MRYFFLITLLIISLSTFTIANCSMEYFPKSAMEKVGNYETSYNFRINGYGGDRPEISYTTVLSSKTNYRVVVAAKDGRSEGIIMTIYDKDCNVITTNYKDGKFGQVTDFQPEKTGIYYIIFSFKNSESYCGLAKLVFQRI